MRAKLNRPRRGRNPDYRPHLAELARAAGRPYVVPREIDLRAGTIIDDPEAYKLVQQGIAIPDDEECAAACGMTTQQMFQAAKAADKAIKGIHPQHYQAYDAGLFDRYDDETGLPVDRAGNPVDLPEPSNE